MAAPTDTAGLREMLARVSQEADDIRYYGGPPSTYTPAADALKRALAGGLPAMLDEIDTLRARVEELEGLLAPFAETALWAERNSHDLERDFDMLLRGPGDAFAGHLHAQSKDFIAARTTLQGTKP